MTWLLGLALVPALAAPQQPPASSPNSEPDRAVESALKDSVLRNPESFAAQYALGSFYAGNERLSEAIPHLERACGVEPAHYGCEYDLALAYFKSSALEKARSRLQAMLRDRDAAELHNLLGAVEEAAGNPTLAAQEMQRAAEMEPTEKHVFDFGNILLKYRAYQEALRILEYGVKQFPKSPRISVAFGVSLYSLGRYDEAVEAVCEGVDLDPADTRALYFLGKMLDISPAMAAKVGQRLENFVRLYPENAAAHYFYALSLWKGTGDPNAADLGQVEKLLKRAVSLDANNAGARFQLGSLYESLGRDSDAIREFESAVTIDPKYESAHYRLGRIYLRAGDKARAQSAMDAYQKLHRESRPENTDQQPQPRK